MLSKKDLDQKGKCENLYRQTSLRGSQSESLAWGTLLPYYFVINLQTQPEERDLAYDYCSTIPAGRKSASSTLATAQPMRDRH